MQKINLMYAMALMLTAFVVPVPSFGDAGHEMDQLHKLTMATLSKMKSYSINCGRGAIYLPFADTTFEKVDVLSHLKNDKNYANYDFIQNVLIPRLVLIRDQPTIEGRLNMMDLSNNLEGQLPIDVKKLLKKLKSAVQEHKFSENQIRQSNKAFTDIFNYSIEEFKLFSEALIYQRANHEFSDIFLQNINKIQDAYVQEKIEHIAPYARAVYSTYFHILEWKSMHSEYIDYLCSYLASLSQLEELVAESKD